MRSVILTTPRFEIQLNLTFERNDLEYLSLLIFGDVPPRSGTPFPFLVPTENRQYWEI